MRLNEDELCDAIVRLMSRGVRFVRRQGKLHVIEGKTAGCGLASSEITSLKGYSADIMRLVGLSSPAHRESKGGEAHFEGKLLARHLVKLWKKVESGDRDLSFTNLTHSSVRIPSEVTEGRFFEAARVVIERHPALRLTFTADVDSTYRIGQASLLEADIRYEELPGKIDDQFIRSRASDMVWERLENSKGMSRFFLIKCSSYSILGLVINHFVADLTSVSLVMRELIAVCRGQDIARNDRGEMLECQFIASLLDEYDYSSDSQFALARAYWRDQTSKAVYRREATEALPQKGWVTKIDFTISGSLLQAFQKFMQNYGLTHLGLFMALHASAQCKIFGGSTTVMLVGARNRGGNPGYVGKMDDIKPVNIKYLELVSCAKEVANDRILAQKMKFIPYEVFPTIIYNGASPKMPFLNLIVNNNVGANLTQVSCYKKTTPPVIIRDRYVMRTDERPDFEDYYLQIVVRHAEVNVTLTFFEDNISVREGEALASEMLLAFGRLIRREGDLR